MKDSDLRWCRWWPSVDIANLMGMDPDDIPAELGAYVLGPVANVSWPKEKMVAPEGRS